MQIQQDISAELNTAKKGKEFKVLIDRKEGAYYIGRTEFDSPEVDNEVLIREDSGDLIIGEFYQVRIIDTSEYDLFGELVGRNA